MRKVSLAPNGQFVYSDFMLHYCYSFEWFLKSSNWILCESGYSGSMLSRCVTVRYQVRSKHSNCTVNPSKYGKENLRDKFHHNRQARLIHYFGREKTPLLPHMIQCRIRVRPGYFINRIKPAWPGKNVTMQVDLDNPDDPTRFQSWCTHAWLISYKVLN